jgi:hypothetical protein
LGKKDVGDASHRGTTLQVCIAMTEQFDEGHDKDASALFPVAGNGIYQHHEYFLFAMHIYLNILI